MANLNLSFATIHPLLFPDYHPNYLSHTQSIYNSAGFMFICSYGVCEGALAGNWQYLTHLKIVTGQFLRIFLAMTSLLTGQQ